MYVLKFAVTLFAFLPLLTVDCCNEYHVRRVPNEHGLFEPRIERVVIPPEDLTGTNRPPTPEKRTFPALEMPMYKLLAYKSLDNIPLLMYVQSKVMSGGVEEKYNFRLNQFEVNGKTIYGIELHSKATTNAQSYIDTHAYWVPQGGYTDIPADPTIRNDPKFLFTPTFSGCTMAIDLIEKEVDGRMERMYRVHHVEGGKEDVQYNNADIDHGFGMLTSMEYRNYGYFRREGQVKFTQNYQGSAFMAYDEQLQKWILYYQSHHDTEGFVMASISEMSFEKGVKQVKGLITPNLEVVNSAFDILVPAHAADFHTGRVARRNFAAAAAEDLQRRQSDIDAARFNCV